MKNLILSLFFIFPFFAFSQQYTPMLRENAVWNIIGFFYWEEFSYTYQFRFHEDIESINGKPYRRAEMRSKKSDETEWSEWEDQAFLLFENIYTREVYIYYESAIFFDHEPGEFLLYDFSLEEGDYVNFDGFETDMFEGAWDFFITSITYETVLGYDNVKTFHISNNYTYPNEVEFYEGMGAQTGIFTIMGGDGGEYYLTGYQFDELGVEDIFEEISIWPNPVKDRLEIRSQVPLRQLELFDLSGRSLISTSDLEKLNRAIPQLNPGVYLLKIITKDGRLHSLKLIKK